MLSDFTYGRVVRDSWDRLMTRLTLDDPWRATHTVGLLLLAALVAGLAFAFFA